MKRQQKCSHKLSVKVSDTLYNELKAIAESKHWTLSKTIKKLLSQVLGV